MDEKILGRMAIGAALLILFSTMFDPAVSSVITVAILVVIVFLQFGLYKERFLWGVLAFVLAPIAAFAVVLARHILGLS